MQISRWYYYDHLIPIARAVKHLTGTVSSASMREEGISAHSSHRAIPAEFAQKGDVQTGMALSDSKPTSRITPTSNLRPRFGSFAISHGGFALP